MKCAVCGRDVKLISGIKCPACGHTQGSQNQGNAWDWRLGRDADGQNRQMTKREPRRRYDLDFSDDT